MHIISQKLENLKQKLNIWNKTIFGNVNVLVKEVEQKLISIQSYIDNHGATDTLIEQQKVTNLSLENALEKEEEFWKEKSNASWHSDTYRIRQVY